MKTQTDFSFKQIILDESLALPEQAPLEFFVHHNNLHHHEDKPFFESIEKNYYTYGRTPYMSIAYYRNLLKSDKTFYKLCFNHFQTELKKVNIDGCKDYVEYILFHLFAIEDIEQAKFLFQQKKTYNLDRSKVIPTKGAGFEEVFKALSQLDHLVEDEIFPERHVNATISRKDQQLIPFLAAMLDQGQASWQMPEEIRENPMQAFFNYIQYQTEDESKPILAKIKSRFTNSEKYLTDYFASVPESKHHRLIQDLVHALPGWAGMILKLQNEDGLNPRKNVNFPFNDYLAMRIVLSFLQAPQKSPSLITIFNKHIFNESVIHFCTHFKENHCLDEIIKVFAKFNPLALKREFHIQMEEVHTQKVLNLISQKKQMVLDPNPKFQFFFCFDDREESLRRHLEENFPDVATYGAAGFFGFDMEYQGQNQVRTRKQCPPAVTPKFIVKEKRVAPTSKWAEYFLFANTSLVRGMFDLFVMTPLNFLNFYWRLAFPRTFKNKNSGLQISDKSQIQFLNQSGNHQAMTLGYTIEELATRVAGILKTAGLVKNFSPYIITIGHGSDSFNNPHAAAYRCGACSGSNAAPNARLYAITANRKDVREEIKKKYSIAIPDSTRFIGGYHDTCDDRIELYDLDESIPLEDKKRIQYILNEVRQKNAHERIRRFHQIPFGMNEQRALKEVQSRSAHPGEARPELNHATNSICIVGPRKLTQNFFLDRRCFLVSYEPSIDAEGEILKNILNAAVPVCTGINLEYYFSKVDTENYGSGSKTSHNVVGLIGVMNGIRGDLRTGLVWQMVEYHEPLRVIFIIESRREILLKIMEGNSQIKNIVYNGWMHLAVKETASGELFLFKNGAFELFQASEDKINRSIKSRDAYGRKRESIDYCIIGENEEVAK